ncbi:MAG: hypothetical protein ACYDAG_04830 [Chloroflexota bacterium]
MFRGLRCCASVLALAALVVLGAIVYFTQFRPAFPTRAAAAGPAPSPTPASAAAAELDSHVGSFEQTVRQQAGAGKRTPVSLTITQDELTARANQALASGEVQVPASDLRVTVVPGQIVTTGELNAGALSAPFTLTAIPVVTNGQPRLSVQRLDFGLVPVPQAVRDKLVAAVSAGNLLGNLPLEVSSFQAQQGQVVLRGVTRPG